jgi:hypothetical protein
MSKCVLCDGEAPEDAAHECEISCSLAHVDGYYCSQCMWRLVELWKGRKFDVVTVAHPVIGKIRG